MIQPVSWTLSIDKSLFECAWPRSLIAVFFRFFVISGFSASDPQRFFCLKMKLSYEGIVRANIKVEQVGATLWIRQNGEPKKNTLCLAWSFWQYLQATRKHTSNVIAVAVGIVAIGLTWQKKEISKQSSFIVLTSRYTVKSRRARLQVIELWNLRTKANVRQRHECGW